MTLRLWLERAYYSRAKPAAYARLLAVRRARACRIFSEEMRKLRITPFESYPCTEFMRRLGERHEDLS